VLLQELSFLPAIKRDPLVSTDAGQLGPVFSFPVPSEMGVRIAWHLFPRAASFSSSKFRQEH
jgi:hypothetical protein